MNQIPRLAARVITGLFALAGLAGVLPISLAELSSGGACPHFGPIPACHLVSLAYATTLAVVLHPRLWNWQIFLLAWAPIFLLAATGTTLELFGRETCPNTPGGIPKCYFSLALSIGLILPVLVSRRR